MNKKVLLIGRNPGVLSALADALINEKMLVQMTSLVEQADQDFNAADFDLIAFGRGVDEDAKAELKRNFKGQHPGVHFVDGLAPIIPLLVRQITATLAAKPVETNRLVSVSCEQSETIQLCIVARQACRLTVDLYQLDAIHTTRQATLLTRFIEAGSHQFDVDRTLLEDTIASFLLVTADEDEFTVLSLR
ncbi:hypothetical protein GCM10027341_30880 [Spirosoma knui]